MPAATKFRTAVGEVAQQSALMEGMVAILVWGLAGLDQKVARIVVPNNMERMLALIGQLLPIRVDDTELRSEIQSWVADVRRLYKDRGAIIHSVWIGNDDNASYWRADIRPMTDVLDSRTAKDLMELAAEMEKLSTARASFFGRLASSVPGPWSVYSS